MKQIYFLVALLFFSFSGFTQSTTTRTELVPYQPPLPKEPPPVVNTAGITSQPQSPGGTTISTATSAEVPNRLPTASPDATQAKHLQDIPVNLYTGTPTIKIPICGISEAGIGVAVSLNYNVSGIRTHAVSSWTGLGWDLEGIPALNRIVRGLPDEGKVDIKNRQDYYAKDGFYFLPWIGTGDTDTGHDHEPDVFLLNLGNATYRFMFDGARKVNFFPDADIKVDITSEQSPHTFSSYTKVFKEFKITLPNGTQYLFTDENKEETAEIEVKYSLENELYPYQYNDRPRSFQRYLNANSIPSTWYVKKITSPYGHEINFSYHKVKYSYYRLFENGDGIPCPSGSNIKREVNRVFVQSAAIAKIEGTDKVITFNDGLYDCAEYTDINTQERVPYCYYKYTDKSRQDIDAWQSKPANKSNSKILENISYYDKNTPADKHTWTFAYDYFTAISNNGHDLPSSYSYTEVGKTHQKRLKLTMFATPDSSKYIFNYYGDNDTTGKFKNRFSYGVDHWGFANGHDENIKLTGLLGYDYISNCDKTQISNREPNESQAHYGSLSKITLMGSANNLQTETNFKYEYAVVKNYTYYKKKFNYVDPNPNPVSLTNIIPQIPTINVPYHEAGGLRIQNIEIKDLIRGTHLVKKYDYRLTTGEKSGFLFVQPIYRFNDKSGGTLSNSSLYDYLSGESSRPAVGHSRVEETINDGVGNLLIRNVSSFDQDETELSTKQEHIDCKWIYSPTNKPTIQECKDLSTYYPEYFTPQYDFRSGNLLKSEQYNENNTLLSESRMSYTLGNGIVKDNQTYCRRVFRMNEQTYYHDYYYNFSKYRLEAQDNYTYSPDGSGKKISSHTTYTYKDEMPSAYRNTYKGKHNQIVKVVNLSDDGFTTQAYTKYAADFSFDVDTIQAGYCDTDTEHPELDPCRKDIVSHIPASGTEARSIYELQRKGISAAVIESHSIRNNKVVSASYQTYYPDNSPYKTLPKSSYVLRNAPTTSFAEITYNKNTERLIKDQGYGHERLNFLAYNHKGLLEKSAPRKGAVTEISYNAGGLLKTSETANAGIRDALTTRYEYGQRFNQLSKVTTTNGTEVRYEYDYMGRLISTKDQDGNIIKHYIYQN